MPEASLDLTRNDDLKHLIDTRHGSEPLWLRERRYQSAQHYVDLPFPKLERTPLKKRRLESIPALDPLPAVTGGGDADVHVGLRLQFANGELIDRELSPKLRDAGVLLMSLNQAVVEAPQLVEQYLGQILDPQRDKLQAMNDAFWQTGLFLYVPPRVHIGDAITVTHHLSAEARGYFPRSLVIADRESQVTVSEIFLSDEGSSKALFSGGVEIVAMDGAQVDYGSIQQLGSHVDGFMRRAGKTGRDAHLNWNIGEFGGGLWVAEHDAKLLEPGGQTNSITVFFGSGTQHQDYAAKSFHVAPNTKSNMVARGVMADRSRSIFTGLTDIQLGARGADGRQKEQTLMLSDDARADAIPSLVIEERDVFAAHAASAGPVDKGALFYLTARGIREKDAIRLVVHGFLAPVIDAISQEALRERIWAAVERKINL